VAAEVICKPCRDGRYPGSSAWKVAGVDLPGLGCTRQEITPRGCMINVAVPGFGWSPHGSSLVP